jgi:hypothetical protein
MTAAAFTRAIIASLICWAFILYALAELLT